MVDIDKKILGDLEESSLSELYRLVYRDDFDCLNRKYFEHFCSGSRLDITNGNFSVMISDADSFKIINDSFGHAWGDLAIKKLFQTSQKVTEDYSKSCGEVTRSIRFGGDEGLVISLTKSRDTKMFEDVLMQASKTLLQPTDPIINTATEEVGLKNIQVQLSGGFVHAKDYISLPREVFPTRGFVDSINERLTGGIEHLVLEEEGRETITSRRLTPSLGEFKLEREYLKEIDEEFGCGEEEKKEFEYGYLGIEKHQFESIISYLTKLGYGPNREFTLDDLNRSSLAGIPNLYAVAMTSEADARLYQAKKVLGGFCYGPDKIKSWDSSNLELEDLTLEQILERNRRYNQLKKKSDR